MFPIEGKSKGKQDSVVGGETHALPGGLAGGTDANLLHGFPPCGIRVVGLFSRSPFFLELVINSWVVLVVNARLINFRPGVGAWPHGDDKVVARNSWTYQLKTALTSVHSGLLGLALAARLS